MSDTLAGILDAPKPPALFIGNGINRHRSVGGHTGWENLLEQLAKSQGMTLTERQLEEMSKTEVFDILDLARPKEDTIRVAKSMRRSRISPFGILTGW